MLLEAVLSVMGKYQYGTKQFRYNWHSAGSVRWLFPMLKYVQHTEAILSNSNRKLLWFEITKMLITLKKINLLCCLL